MEKIFRFVMTQEMACLALQLSRDSREQPSGFWRNLQQMAREISICSLMQKQTGNSVPKLKANTHAIIIAKRL